jgi:hypothetical protein
MNHIYTYNEPNIFYEDDHIAWGDKIVQFNLSKITTQYTGPE